MRSGRRLVVNADDLGRTPGINDGIFEAHSHGIVSSATLMVGFEAARDAAAQIADHPRLGVGLHVTLTGARPTLPPEEVPSLVDGEGRFAPKPEAIGKIAPAEVLAEARNQLRLFHELVGRPPTHLDSHHHSHRHPAILEALVELAREHGLPVRRSSPAIARRLSAAGLRTTDAFVERFFDREASVDVLLEILSAAGPGSTEVMCHPGRVDDELRFGSSYSEPREREIAVLCDPAVAAAVRHGGFQLASFAEACGL